MSRSRLPFTLANYRAVRDGQKTQTRRIVKGAERIPKGVTALRPFMADCHPDGTGGPCWQLEAHREGRGWGEIEPGPDFPSYVPGDVVGLTLPHARQLEHGVTPVAVWDEVTKKVRFEDGGELVVDVAGVDHDDRWRKNPAFLMPRWACLDEAVITAVRAERLQDISEDGCVLEGIRQVRSMPARWDYPGAVEMYATAPKAYRAEWDALNAERGHPWADNPWVWVIDFELKESDDV